MHCERTWPRLLSDLHCGAANRPVCPNRWCSRCSSGPVARCRRRRWFTDHQVSMHTNQTELTRKGEPGAVYRSCVQFANRDPFFGAAWIHFAKPWLGTHNSTALVSESTFDLPRCNRSPNILGHHHDVAAATHSARRCYCATLPSSSIAVNEVRILGNTERACNINKKTANGAAAAATTRGHNPQPVWPCCTQRVAAAASSSAAAVVA